MPNASQHIHLSPHHPAPCSAPCPERAERPPFLGDLREDREGPSRLQSDVGQSSPEGVTAERG